jgi:hypothetical protein
MVHFKTSKTDIEFLDGVWCSDANETMVMRAAKQCGLEVGATLYKIVAKSFVLKRFDQRAECEPDQTLGHI